MLRTGSFERDEWHVILIRGVLSNILIGLLFLYPYLKMKAASQEKTNFFDEA